MDIDSSTSLCNPTDTNNCGNSSGLDATSDLVSYSSTVDIDDNSFVSESDCSTATKDSDTCTAGSNNGSIAPQDDNQFNATINNSAMVDDGNATIDSTLVATSDTTNVAMAASNATNNGVMLAISDATNNSMMIATSNATNNSMMLGTSDVTNNSVMLASDATNNSVTMITSNTTNNSVMLATSSNNAITEAACRNNAVGITEPVQELPEYSIAETLVPFECDIGKLLHNGINIQNLTREQKYRLLTCNPNPNPSSYPRTRLCASDCLRQFQPKWIKKHPCIHYSVHVNGIYCRACAAFAPEKVGGQVPGWFVTKEFNNWINISQKLDNYSKTDSHKTCLVKMEEYVKRYNDPSKAINSQCSSKTQKQLKDNQSVIESLFKVVLLCGKQGIPLRGHGIDWNDEEPHDNQGNFIELIRFRADTDNVLKTHLKNAPKNAIYTSKTIQEQLIFIIGEQIRNEILEEVRSTQYYSIIVDEVCDISNKEQLSISLRYALNGSVKEIFMDFVPVARITGSTIAEAILDHLSLWKLPLANLRGQCYDGSSNMAGARSGYKAIILQQAPMALYTHCAAHQLNLAVVAACSIQVFKNAESYIGEMARFFKFSAKRQALLDKAMDTTNPAPKAKKLKDACRTRWIERIDLYIVFLELIPAVHKTLQAMTSPVDFSDLGDWSWDSETVTKASGFLYQLESSSFLITFIILLEVLSNLRGLTCKLQMEAIDVLYAHKQVKQVTTTFEKMWRNSEQEFRRIYKRATKLGKDLNGEGFELSTPRLSKRQSHRANPDSQTTEDYYRATLLNEFLSHVVSELQQRFLDSPLCGLGLLHLLPSECISAAEVSGNHEDIVIPQSLVEAVQFYENDLPHPVMFSTEYHIWVRKW